MSIVSTSLRVQHRGTGLSFSASETRNVTEEGVAMSSLSIGSTDETLSYGDVLVPRQVALRLVSGSPVEIGLINGGPYPFALNTVNEGMVLRLNTGNAKAVSTFMTGAEGGTLDGTHIELFEAGNTEVWPWFSVGDKAVGTITYGVPVAATGGSGTITLGTMAMAKVARGVLAFFDPVAIGNNVTVTIGSVTYTWKTAGNFDGVTANHLLIGATTEECSTTLYNAIRRNSSGRGTTYGYDTVANPDCDVDYASDLYGAGKSPLVITAKTRGTAGNLIDFTESSVGTAKYNYEAPYGSYSHGSVLYGGVDGDSVTVGPHTWTRIDPLDETLLPMQANEFIDPWELEEKINATANYNATRVGMVITVTAELGVANLTFTETGTGIALFPNGGTLDPGSDPTEVMVGDQTFSYVASGATGNQFSSITQLTALINAMATVNATHNGTGITVVAATAGTAGNAIVFDLGANPGTMSITGSGTLAGGTDGAAAPTAVTAGERLIKVNVETGATAAQVASALAAALQADTAFNATAAADLVAVTDATYGTRDTSTEGDTGWTAPGFSQGSVLPEIHLKSEGSSQLFVAVTPQ